MVFIMRTSKADGPYHRNVTASRQSCDVGHTSVYNGYTIGLNGRCNPCSEYHTRRTADCSDFPSPCARGKHGLILHYQEEQ